MASFPIYKVRVCRDCKQSKQCGWNYAFTQKGTPTYYSRCRKCHNKYSAERQRARRPRGNVYRRKVIAERKRKCIELLGNQCGECGYSNPLALTFHHKDSKTKLYEIGAILDWKWETIELELAKCILLCWNCHMEIHGKERHVRIQTEGEKRTSN